MHIAAISGPSGRVYAAPARLNAAVISPAFRSRYKLRQTTASTTKKVNCRVSSPPPEVHTAKVALLPTNPKASHAVSQRRSTPGSRAAHHSIAPSVPTVNPTDNHCAAYSGATPKIPQIAASSSTHRKLEYPSTYSPGL